MIPLTDLEAIQRIVLPTRWPRCIMGFLCMCGNQWRKETTMVQQVTVRPA